MITTYTYDRANRLKQKNAGGTITTYTLDAAGNRIAETTGSESVTYQWDAAGRMIAAEVASGTVTFIYNTDGQRTAKQATDGSATGFLYDYKRLLHETDEVGGDITKSYAVGTDEEYGDLIGEDGEMIHQYDAQANTNALLDNTGLVAAQYKYRAFGQVAAVSVEGGVWTSFDTLASLTANEWGSLSVDAWAELPVELTSNMLAGGRKQYYLDPETELYLLGMGTTGRYYDPKVGKFISEDPIRHKAGDPNLLRYVKNNPVNHLDPSGHDDDSDEAKKKAEESARRQREDNQAKQQQHQQNNVPGEKEQEKKEQEEKTLPAKGTSTSAVGPSSPAGASDNAQGGMTLTPGVYGDFPVTLTEVMAGSDAGSGAPGRGPAKNDTPDKKEQDAKTASNATGSGNTGKNTAPSATQSASQQQGATSSGAPNYGGEPGKIIQMESGQLYQWQANPKDPARPILVPISKVPKGAAPPTPVPKVTVAHPSAPPSSKPLSESSLWDWAKYAGWATNAGGAIVGNIFKKAGDLVEKAGAAVASDSGTRGSIIGSAEQTLATYLIFEGKLGHTIGGALDATTSGLDLAHNAVRAGERVYKKTGSVAKGVLTTAGYEAGSFVGARQGYEAYKGKDLVSGETLAGLDRAGRAFEGVSAAAGAAATGMQAAGVDVPLTGGSTPAPATAAPAGSSVSPSPASATPVAPTTPLAGGASAARPLPLDPLADPVMPSANPTPDAPPQPAPSPNPAPDTRLEPDYNSGGSNNYGDLPRERTNVRGGGKSADTAETAYTPAPKPLPTPGSPDFVGPLTEEQQAATAAKGGANSADSVDATVKPGTADKTAIPQPALPPKPAAPEPIGPPKPTTLENGNPALKAAESTGSKLPGWAKSGLDDVAKFRQELGQVPGSGKPDGGVIAKLEIGDQSFYGVNAHGQPVNLRANAITSTHAEMDAFQQAANAGVKGGTARLYVDSELCGACGQSGGVKSLARQLGVTKLEVVTPKGVVTVNP